MWEQEGNAAPTTAGNGKVSSIAISTEAKEQRAMSGDSSHPGPPGPTHEHSAVPSGPLVMLTLETRAAILAHSALAMALGSYGGTRKEE